MSQEMRTPAQQAQKFADEVRTRKERNLAEMAHREYLYGVWRKPLESLEQTLNQLTKELLNRLRLPGATDVSVRVIHYRLVFDWQSEHGSVQVDFEPTHRGVCYRVKGEDELLPLQDSPAFSQEELACGIIINRLGNLILPRLPP